MIDISRRGTNNVFPFLFYFIFLHILPNLIFPSLSVIPPDSAGGLKNRGCLDLAFF